MPDVFREVVDFLKNYADFEEGEVKEDSQLKADLGLDSLTLVEVADDAERHFQIAVADEELIAIRTVGDIVRIIEKNK